MSARVTAPPAAWAATFSISGMSALMRLPLRKSRYSASLRSIALPCAAKRLRTQLVRIPASCSVNSMAVPAFFTAFTAASRPSGSASTLCTKTSVQ